ncbi:MAG: peptidoglycan-binding domain-containing protein [Bryobacteraceae bacterium]
MFVSKAVILALTLGLIPSALFLQAESPAAKKGKKKASAAVSSRKSKQPAHTASSKQPLSRASASSKRVTVSKRISKTTARSSQRQPTSERYQEIQRALSERGYYQGDVSGNWGPESIEALRKFQRDQKLADDGKLSSKSIIALGLGPQRTAAAATDPH